MELLFSGYFSSVTAGYFSSVTPRYSVTLRYRINMQSQNDSHAKYDYMSANTVSVIMPTYNRPERLQRALTHLQAQHDPDWEALVVDDGDGRGYDMALSLRDVGDERIRAFRNTGKQQVDARNTAIVQASGSIIAWLDDDDWWEHPDHVALLKQTLQEPGLAHVHGWVVREHAEVDDNPRETREVFNLPATADSLQQDNTLLTSSIAYPKTFHQELGLLDRSLNGYFDWDWIVRVLAAGYPLKTIDILSVCYLMHGNNGSAQVHNPRRVRDFTAFRDKHNLDIIIKSHDAVLQENHPATATPN